MTNIVDKRNCVLGLVLAFVLSACGSDKKANNPQTIDNAAIAGNNTVAAGTPSSNQGDAGSSATIGAGGLGSTGSSTGRGGTGTGLAGSGSVKGGSGEPGGAAGVTAGSGGASGASGAAAGKGGAGGGGVAGTSTGESCAKGQVKPSEVVIIGESFYALSPQYIQKRIEQNARAAGSLGANESYRNVAVSATWLSRPPSDMPTQFDTALAAGPVKNVIMDGGGNDCMQSSCDSCPGIFKTLLEKMASNGVQDVIYTRYPEPGNPPGSNATLKANLDTLMPKMEAVCAATTGLRCYWLDLRPVWKNGDTTDGLHATQSGGEHVGDAIWAEMVKDCMAQ
jgi:hypothetical protein